MRSLIALFPVLLGSFTVFQAGLNRKIGQAWGLPVAVLFNACVLVAGAVVLLGVSAGGIFESSFLRPHFDSKQFTWWFLLPGLFGLGLVWGGPWCISKLGAVPVFVLMVSAQLLTSVFWDVVVEQRSISGVRLCGVALAWAGALLATWSK